MRKQQEGTRPRKSVGTIKAVTPVSPRSRKTAKVIKQSTKKALKVAVVGVTWEEMLGKNHCGLHHTDRTYDTKIHQGQGGVFFVFQQQGYKEFRVREYFRDNGHTHVNLTRRYATSVLAHKAAQLLSGFTPAVAAAVRAYPDGFEGVVKIEREVKKALRSLPPQV